MDKLCVKWILYSNKNEKTDNLYKQILKQSFSYSCGIKV